MQLYLSKVKLEENQSQTDYKVEQLLYRLDNT